MAVGIALMIFQVIALPVIFSLWLGLSKQVSKLHWLFLTILVGAYCWSLWTLGLWFWFHVNLKWIVPVLFVGAVLASLRHLSGVPNLPPRKVGALINLGILFLIGGLFTLQALAVLGGSKNPAGSIDLAFPLEGGRFVVGHGGDSPLVNYHNAYKSQAYALDILGLNSSGRRANGVFPENLEDYAIYGARIVSPCNGHVVETDDGHENQIPGIPNEPKFPAGNHVVISCHNVNIVLAHMQPGSLKVSEGDMVETGDLVGLVGNSGNTSEPHLHVHAEQGGTDTPVLKGVGVPLTFERRFLIRNDIVDKR